ncbi:hypothetical protein ThidrDRAFT_1952 [Thiorhodococcus drewsii AZ1]|uniref:Uncharacterized protein n=1 Tax=Thiorhodococcus drewsii AZ1 TaxID=765913 RepID=G2E0Y9_9GAMM|nr:hypothetical protein ThidrDRAFT_1952 [Thiorhodococcus drewsii AZ1]
MRFLKRIKGTWVFRGVRKTVVSGYQLRVSVLQRSGCLLGLGRLIECVGLGEQVDVLAAQWWRAQLLTFLVSM